MNPIGEDEADNKPPTYDLIGGIFHKEVHSMSAQFTVILKCGDIWINYDDDKFKPYALINSKNKKKALVVYHRMAYFLFYKRNENTSICQSQSEDDSGPMPLDYLNPFGIDNISDLSNENEDQSIQSNTNGLTNVTQTSSVTTHVLPPTVTDICDSPHNSDK